MNKKVLFLVLCGFGLLVLTGCGGKKLHCEINMDSFFRGYGNMKGIINVGFDKDGYASDVEVIMDGVVTSDEVKSSDMSEIKSRLEDVCKSNGSKYKNCDVSVNGKNFTMKASTSVKDSYSDLGERKTKEEAVEYFEKLGFTCN